MRFTKRKGIRFSNVKKSTYKRRRNSLKGVDASKDKRTSTCSLSDLMQASSNGMYEADIIKVTCGNIHGQMHRKNFICPGIHTYCIEGEDGTMVTPKMFSVMGEKENLKDWKNAIRIDGITLRKLMENGHLDFCNHESRCSGRCASRAPGQLKDKLYEMKSTGKLSRVGTSKPRNEKTILILPKPEMSTASSNIVPVPSQNVFPQAMIVNANAESSIDPFADDQDEVDGLSDEVDIKPSPEELRRLVMENYPGMNEEDEEKEEIDMDESQIFWRGIMQVGLLDEIFRDIKSSIDVLKNNLIRSKARLTDCHSLDNVVMELGITQKLKTKLAMHKNSTELETDQINMELEALKNKMKATEQKQLQLKRKSQRFDQLMEMGQKKRPKSLEDNTPSSSNDTGAEKDTSNTSDS